MKDLYDPDELKTCVSLDQFLFFRKKELIATALFCDLKLQPKRELMQMEQCLVECTLEDFMPGETIMVQGQPVLLGPQREFTHEVSLRAYGNPDYDQYADIARRKRVMCCGEEEARKIVADYQTAHNMGSGNIGPDHGVLYSIRPDGTRIREGRFSPNLRFWKEEGSLV